MQEGHRLEFEKADDPGSNLVYKGVVYNEMIGSMGSPVNTVWQTLTKYVFPSTTYHYNSGGDPEHIPDLTYEQFMEFYKTHYHPSNAIFMTYGDIPAYELQERIESRALSHFDPWTNTWQCRMKSAITRHSMSKSITRLTMKKVRKTKPIS
jgi:hypothetical protein